MDMEKSRSNPAYMEVTSLKSNVFVTAFGELSWRSRVAKNKLAWFYFDDVEVHLSGIRITESILRSKTHRIVVILVNS